MLILHASIAILAAIGLIIWVKVDPVIALVLSCIYLGLTAGLGAVGTVEAITAGFGDIMISVGLLIGFGVLIGALLHSMGTFRDLVRIIASRMGKKLPYAIASTLATIFPSIYVDVQVVLAAPMARQSAPAVERRTGLAWLAGALGVGIFAGYVFVVPGLAAVGIAGKMSVPLGTYLLYGVPIGLATALITTFLFRLLLRGRYWNEATDLDEDVIEATETPDDALAAGEAKGQAADESIPANRAARLPLVVRLTPILVPLVLIAFGAFADLLGFSNSVIAFLGDANIALFIGLLIAFVISRVAADADATNAALSSGFATTGEILLITGVGGSLGFVIEASGLAAELGGLFDAESGAPVLVSILLAWFVAALLHFAIGSVSVGAFTATSLLVPIVGSLGVDPVVIALAIASGAMFALHVNSNFFWMFKSLLGLSTKGTLKTLTMTTSMGAVVSLPLVILASFIA